MSELQNTLSSKTEALNAELQALRSQLGTASDDLSLVRGWKSDTYIVNIHDNNITVVRSSSAETPECCTLQIQTEAIFAGSFS